MSIISTNILQDPICGPAVKLAVLDQDVQHPTGEAQSGGPISAEMERAYLHAYNDAADQRGLAYCRPANAIGLQSDLWQMPMQAEMVTGLTLRMAVVDWGRFGNDSVLLPASLVGPLQLGVGHDTFVGGNSADTVYGGEGNDTLWGNGGNDTLRGDQDDDLLYGGDGDDRFLIETSDAGNDIYFGGGGNDTLVLGDPFGVGDLVLSRLVLNVGASVERLFMMTSSLVGSALDDLINFSGVTSIQEFSFGWSIFLSSGNDTFIGSATNDSAYGGMGDDILSGNAGNDVLGDRDGINQYYGGEGDDRIFTGSDIGQVVEGEIYRGGAGIDTFLAESGTYRELDLSAAAQFEILGASFIICSELDDRIDLSGIQVVIMSFSTFLNGGNDIFLGTAVGDSVEGYTGNDTIWGLGGSDLVYGQDGNDTIVDTTAGRDTYFGGNGTDTLILNRDITSAVFDMVAGTFIPAGSAALSWTSFENVLRSNQDVGVLTILGTAENNLLDIRANRGKVTLSGLDGNDRLVGGNGNDVLFGGAGADTLDGGMGTDSLVGGDGNDTYFYSNLGDLLSEAGLTDTADRVLSNINANLGLLDIDIENLYLTGINNSFGTGSDRNNLISGNSGNNMLSGLGGNDALNGWAGNDTLRGGTGNDTLAGGSGNDRLEGNAGNDRLTGGLGGDHFVFFGIWGVDVVADFVIAEAGEVIDLSAVPAIVDFADLVADHLSQVGANAVITVGANTLSITGVTVSALTADDFVL